MLGGFGEVLLVDWGSAVPTADQQKAGNVGTPWYMSPAQARSEASTTACGDIYGLGATLFHLLCLRPPLDAVDEEEFWRRKRAGEIDPPTPAERATVPRHLLAIALKALAADPAQLPRTRSPSSAPTSRAGSPGSRSAPAPTPSASARAAWSAGTDGGSWCGRWSLPASPRSASRSTASG